jgi:hypothetical protein
VGQLDERAEKDIVSMKGARGLPQLRTIGVIGWVLVPWLALICGCGGSGASAAAPDAKERITQLSRLYKAYFERNKKGPADEKSLREFGQKLTPEERKGYLVGDDIESLFVSPRDKQKYVIRYNQRLEPTGAKGVIWEAEGQGGRRFVALTNGYVEEYGEAMFKDYTK